MTRAAAAVAGVVALLLPGCLEGAPGEGALVTAPVRVGDVAEYEVAGAWADLVRWLPELPAEPRRVRFSVTEAGDRIDAGLVPHATFAVTLEADGGAGWQPVDTRFVDAASGRVVEVLTPFNETERVVSWEELGGAWLFGAGPLVGRTVQAETLVTLPAAAGQSAALPLPFRAVRDGDAWRVETRGLVDLAYVWRDGEAWPESFAVTLRGGSEGYAVSAFARDASFEGRRVSHEPGGRALAPTEESVDIPGPVAPLTRFDGRAPPESAAALVFPLQEAMEVAERQDLALRAFLSAAPETMLYRATYYLGAPAAAGAPAEPTWNLGYVSPDERYHEVKVARIAGLALHRTFDSAEVAAPRGAHGFLDAAALPREMLPLDGAVGKFLEVFGEEGYEIFVRSFTGDARGPAGYYYLIDGGFDRPAGRYTTTWNAQTGRLESAVGPVEPR